MFPFEFKKEPKVCEVRRVKFGGQPGDYACVCVNSIFQQGNKVFEGKRKEGFNEKRASELLKMQNKLWCETGVPERAGIVANTGQESMTYIDFVTFVSNMPFCVDATWQSRGKSLGTMFCFSGTSMFSVCRAKLRPRWKRPLPESRPTSTPEWMPCGLGATFGPI